MTWTEFIREMEKIGVKGHHEVKYELRPNILKPHVVEGLLTVDTLDYNPCQEIVEEVGVYKIPKGMTREEFEKWLDESGQRNPLPKTLSANVDWDKMPSIRKSVERLLGSGYYNDYGVRVPNPCGEIDSKGRDMDKVHSLMQPGWKYNEETLDLLNSFRVPNCKCSYKLLKNEVCQIGYHQIRCRGPEGLFHTRYVALRGCHICKGTGCST